MNAAGPKCAACGFDAVDVRDIAAYLGVLEPVCCGKPVGPVGFPDLHVALEMERAGEWWGGGDD